MRLVTMKCRYREPTLTQLSGEQRALNSDGLIEIHRLLNLAAARGHPKATDALLQVTDQMTPQELTAAQGKARDFVAKIPEQPIHVWYAAEQSPSTNVIADLPGGNEHVERATLAITDSVQLGVHAAFGSTNQTAAPQSVGKTIPRIIF
jgi:hypothetical protein